MKLIIDAQLPFKLAKYLSEKGLDVIHTDDLPNKELTTDSEIRRISEVENRIVVTKDSDFLDSYLVRKIPSKLLIITTGNINNRKLLKLISNHFNEIVELFKDYSFVEMNSEELIGHE